MNEARPYASLSSGLLARKGTAKPAMRPQGYNGNIEDLGWNDMGQGPAQPPQPAPEHVPSSIAALTPAPTPGEHHEGEEISPEEYYGEMEEVDEVDEIEAGEEQDVYADHAAQPIESRHEFHDEIVDHGSHDTDHLAHAPESYDEDYGADIEDEACEEYGAEGEPYELPSVAAQQRAILEQFADEQEADAAPPASVRAEIVPLKRNAKSAGGRKAAFTLRLDAERHLRLRLACAVTRHSAQQIVARALDEALANIPEIEALVSQVPAKPGRTGKV